MQISLRSASLVGTFVPSCRAVVLTRISLVGSAAVVPQELAASAVPAACRASAGSGLARRMGVRSELHRRVPPLRQGWASSTSMQDMLPRCGQQVIHMCLQRRPNLDPLLFVPWELRRECARERSGHSARSMLKLQLSGPPFCHLSPFVWPPPLVAGWGACSSGLCSLNATESPPLRSVLVDGPVLVSWQQTGLLALLRSPVPPVSRDTG